MKPDKGQHVKCLLINSAMAEGVVEEWNSDYVKLRSLADQSIVIIHHPERDIMLTKIVFEKIVEDSEVPSVEELIEVKTELEQEFVQEYEKPSDDDLRTKNLAKLKIMLIEQDKKIVAEKLKDHHIADSTRTVKYGYPGFFSKPSIK